MEKRIKTGYNIGLAIWRLKCFYETFVQGSTFVLRLYFSAKNPPHRQAAKRYVQPRQDTMNIKITFLILLTVGLLTSCEYVYTYSYSVTNSCDTTIDIKVKTFRIDSVFKVAKDETKVLFMKEHGIEGPKGPYARDVNKDLNIFTVTKGQAQSNRDYLKNNNWSFEKGVYSTIVTNAEF